jgi:amino acid transporter
MLAGLGGASAAAGLAMAGAVALFAVPLVIWLRYARRVNGAGGLYSFVEAAAGRRVALVQAGLWIASYLLYLLYTTAQIVYDTLPAVLPAERRYQPVLEIAIPVALAGVMIAGRRTALLVTGVLAAGQIVLAAALGGVTLAHLPVPVSSFAGPAPAGALASAAGQTSLLYICGSLPLFLGAALALSAPVTLINPDRIYSFLIKPSLIALWLSQLIVFAVYPRFAARQHDRRLPAWALTVVATAFALYGLWVTIQHSAT